MFGNEFDINEMGAETGAEGVEEQEITDPADDNTESGVEEQEITDPAKSKNSADSAFAEMRRGRQEAERRIAELEARLKEKDDALGLFFEGDNKEAQAIAFKNQRPVEDVMQEMKAKKDYQELLNRYNDLKMEAVRAHTDLQMDRDLRRLQEIDPTIKSLDELGGYFLNLISSGADCVNAYYSSRERTAAENRKPATPPGKVSDQQGEKEFFTKEEVEHMTPAEIKKNFEKIRKSQGKW